MHTIAPRPRLTLIGAAVPALMITLGLFLLMQRLIAAPDFALGADDPLPTIRFGVEVPEIEPLVVDPIRPPEPPPEPPREPERPTRPATETVIDRRLPRIAAPSLSGGDGPALPFGTPGGARPAGTGGLVPQVVMPPRYPPRALHAGQEGDVLVEIIVAADGRVIDARVIEASVRRHFDDAAIAAVLRWRFQPREADAGPVTLRQLIAFTLDDG